METSIHAGSLFTPSVLRKTAAFSLALAVSGCVPPRAPPPQAQGNPGYAFEAKIPPAAPKSNEQILKLDRQITRVEKNYRSTTADISRRLALMENEVHLLRGDVDLSRHENKRLKERMADLGKRKPAVAAAAFPATTSRVASTTAAAAVVAAKVPSISRMPESSQSVYDRAFQLLKRSDYEKARVGFEKFLVKFPDDGLADNAQYWIGELQYVQRQFSEALVAFNQVLIRWPASAKVPGSLLKIGFSFHELGDLDNARTSLQRLIGDYPQSPAVVMAKQRLQLIDDGSRGL